jgi:hypothetical protein
MVLIQQHDEYLKTMRYRFPNLYDALKDYTGSTYRFMRLLSNDDINPRWSALRSLVSQAPPGKFTALSFIKLYVAKDLVNGRIGQQFVCKRFFSAAYKEPEKVCNFMSRFEEDRIKGQPTMEAYESALRFLYDKPLGEILRRYGFEMKNSEEYLKDIPKQILVKDLVDNHKVRYFMNFVEDGLARYIGSPDEPAYHFKFGHRPTPRTKNWCCAIQFELDSNFLILGRHTHFPWQSEVIIGPNTYALTGFSRRIMKCEDKPFYYNDSLWRTKPKERYTYVLVTIIHLKQIGKY